MLYKVLYYFSQIWFFNLVARFNSPKKIIQLSSFIDYGTITGIQEHGCIFKQKANKDQEAKLVRQFDYLNHLMFLSSS